MSSEMQDAVSAGIDFWAFVTYPDDDPMSAGLRTYLAITDQIGPRFALITEFGKWGDTNSYRTNSDRFIAMMADPRYQRTPDGRPLLFLGFITEAGLTQRFGGRAGFSAALAEFRQRAVEAKVGNPYIVLMDGAVDRARKLLKDLALDGVSAYAVGDNRVKRGSYQQLTSIVERFWTQASGSGMALIPLAMTGWDRRPRVENPVPWERGLYADATLEQYFAKATPDELKSHLASAIRFSLSQTLNPSPKAVLIYAWNEFDEGGWLAPTRGDGTRRLNAVRRARQESCRN